MARILQEDDSKRKKLAEDEITATQLRGMCDNILFMATKTIGCMELVWAGGSRSLSGRFRAGGTAC